MDFFIEHGYLGLLLSSFLAATILPLSSEIVLVALLLAGLDPIILLAIATIGNVLGSCTNYVLGYFGGRTVVNKFLKVNDKQLEKPSHIYNKYGSGSLLFAWVPVIGDPLTILSGLARTNIMIFITLVFIGKFLRYAAITFGLIKITA